MKKNKILNILYLVVILLYMAIGVFVLIYANEQREKNNVLLGLFILLSSLPALVAFFARGEYKNNHKYVNLAFAIIGISIGIVAMCNKEISLNKICIIWGCFDICRAALEISSIIPELKEHKWLELIDLFIAIGEIVIAIMLIKREFEDVKVHLIYFGITFIVAATKRIVDLFIERVENAKSSSSN